MYRKYIGNVRNLFPGKGLGPGFSLSGEALLLHRPPAREGPAEFKTRVFTWFSVILRGRRINFVMCLSSFRFGRFKKHVFLRRDRDLACFL